jgi:hypothetical protein
MEKTIKKDANLQLSVFDYNSTTAKINFAFGGKIWTIKNNPYFRSRFTAENQARKLAEKLGLNITSVEID